MIKQFFANSELVIETTNGALSYAKGDYVDVRSTKDGTPFVVKHELTNEDVKVGMKAMSPDGKLGTVIEVDGIKFCQVEDTLYKKFKGLTETLNAKIATFHTKDTFDAFVRSIYMKEEMDVAESMQSVAISDLVIREGISPAVVARYLSESRDEAAKSPDSLAEAVTAMTSIVDDSTVKVPVLRRLKRESAKVKMEAIKENLASMPKNAPAARVTAVGYDADNSVDKTGYIVATESMKSAVSKAVHAPVMESVLKAESVSEYTLEESVTAAEGAQCFTKEGKIGKLVKEGEGFVCMLDSTFVSKSVTPGDGFPHVDVSKLDADDAE